MANVSRRVYVEQPDADTRRLVLQLTDDGRIAVWIDNGDDEALATVHLEQEDLARGIADATYSEEA